MKKLSYILIALILIVSSSPVFANAKELSSEEVQYAEKVKEMKDALAKTELNIDLENGSSTEKVVYDKAGKKLGVLGIEEVNSEDSTINNPGTISTLSTTLPEGVNKTFKVYWYTFWVNYSFYTTVYVNPSTGLGKIVSAYDGWYLVVPPGYVSRDTLAITRQYETASAYAEAKYTLNMTAPISTNLWLYARVRNGQFTSGGN